MKYIVHVDDEEWMIDTTQPHVVFCKSQSGMGWYAIVDENGGGMPTTCPCTGFSFGKCRHFRKARKHWNNWPPSGIPVGEPENEDEWMPLKKILGTDHVPVGAGEQIARAIEQMIRRDEVSRDAPWMALEFWAVDYLGGA